MQRLSMIALAAIAVLGLSGAGFTPRAAIAQTLAPTPTPAAPQSQALATAKTATTFANSYYWYDIINGGTYNDYETIAYEEWEMSNMWGCQVDQNPAAGTLIEEGFWSMNPNMPVMVWLYGHFD